MVEIPRKITELDFSKQLYINTMCPKCLKSFNKILAEVKERSCAYKLHIALSSKHIFFNLHSYFSLQWFKKSCACKLFISIFNLRPIILDQKSRNFQKNTEIRISCLYMNIYTLCPKSHKVLINFIQLL